MDPGHVGWSKCLCAVRVCSSVCFILEGGESRHPNETMRKEIPFGTKVPCFHALPQHVDDTIVPDKRSSSTKDDGIRSQNQQKITYELYYATYFGCLT